jgi:flagellar hook protein FlgE
MPNVDLAGQLTGLITAQRAYEANSKVITTSDQVLQTLINLKQG